MFAHRSRPATLWIAAALCALAPASNAQILQTVVSDLDFQRLGQNMWGPGNSFAMDKSWDNFLFNFDSGGPQMIDASV